MKNFQIAPSISKVYFSPTQHMGIQTLPILKIQNGNWVTAGKASVPPITKPS